MKENIVEYEFEKSAYGNDFINMIVCGFEGCKTLDEDAYQTINKYWKNAETKSQFYDLVLQDKSLSTSKLTCQLYAEISKRQQGHWYRIREMFGDKSFKTYSDAGDVKVESQDGSFSVVVGNGYGDGTTRCAIFNEGENFNNSMMNYTGIMLSGKFNLLDYDCDCGKTNPQCIIEQLDGCYAVYNYDGLVAFVK